MCPVLPELAIEIMLEEHFLRYDRMVTDESFLPDLEITAEHILVKVGV